MRNILVVAFIAGLAFVSCQSASKGETESSKVKSDSVAYADSISQIELAKQQIIAAAIDSAKDSIARAKKITK